MAILDRLLIKLNLTNLQIDDPKLYDFLKDLFSSLKEVSNSVASVTGGGGSSIVTNNFVNQFITSLGEDSGNDDLIVIPGPQGIAGTSGTIGRDGQFIFSQAEDGEDGYPIPGLKGDTGNTGSTGSQGAIGPAVFLSVDDGTDGIDGFPGRDGTNGTNGIAGAVGPAIFLVAEDGQDGLDAIPGRIGDTGSQGNTGNTGALGPAVFLTNDDGDDGFIIPGGQGPQGNTGATGASGTGGVPIVVTTNQTVVTQTGWVVPESLEIAAGIIFEIAGGARVEITGPAVTALGTIPTSGWTAVNSVIWNNYTTPQTLGLNVFDLGGGVQWRFLTQSLGSSTTYAVTATIAFDVNQINSTTIGLYIYDGTKIIGLECLDQVFGSGGVMRLRVERMNSVSSDNSTVTGPTVRIIPWPMTLRIVNDGNTRSYYYYANGLFTRFFQETPTAFLTETSVGFGGLCVMGGDQLSQWVELRQWNLIKPYTGQALY